MQQIHGNENEISFLCARVFVMQIEQRNKEAQKRFSPFVALKIGEIKIKNVLCCHSKRNDQKYFAIFHMARVGVTQKTESTLK